MKTADEMEELDEEYCEITTRTEFDLCWTCPNCKQENTEYGIRVETLITCTCENCNKKYEYYTQVY